MRLIYLGTPYTHPDPHVRHERYLLVTKIAAKMIVSNRDVSVYSPVTHFHPMANLCDMPKDFEFWQSHNMRMLRMSDHFCRLLVPGSSESKGLIAEMDMALALGIPVSSDMPEKWGFKTPDQ